VAIFLSGGAIGLKSNVANGGDATRMAFSTKEVFYRKSAEDFSRKTKSAVYAPGDSAGVSVVSPGDSVVAAGASVAAGLVISLAAGALVGAGVVAGVTFSVFCSHAVRSAAPARIQIYFFIIADAYCFNRLIGASAVFGPCRMFFEGANGC
jgi:hypothetical protein